MLLFRVTTVKLSVYYTGDLRLQQDKKSLKEVKIKESQPRVSYKGIQKEGGIVVNGIRELTSQLKS